MGDKATLFFTLLSFFAFGVYTGFILSQYYEIEKVNTRIAQSNISGLFVEGVENHSEALEKVREYEPFGDWVCINIKGRTFQEALETCTHECTHNAYSEILAEKCESNLTNCIDLFKDWGEK